MSFANPTKIRLGMTGTFFGRTYRVIGRSVLGETEASGTYYWNEFNLESSGGKYATLVFEESGSGGPWKFFAMFDPATPMTAKEAATVRTSDPVNLDGTPLRVTLVQRSQVYFVEGKVPEGVRVGQHANYFNAEDADKMEVVSWTGEEVEFYTGQTISAGEVASAFNFTGLSRIGFVLAGGRSLWSARVIFPMLVLGTILVVIIFILSGVGTPIRPAAIVVLPATSPALSAGESGELEGRHYQIASHAVVEIAEVGLRFTRHEYELNDDENDTFLLISGAGSEAGNWTLAAPIEPATPLTPQQAGALPAGQIVNLETESPRIAQLFRSTIVKMDGDAPRYLTGGVFYGFSAPMHSNLLIVRWNATNILWLKGEVIPDRQVRAAFAPPGK